MKHRKISTLVLASALVGLMATASFAAGQAIFINRATTNYVPIVSVVLDDNGTIVDQTASNNAANHRTNPQFRTTTPVQLVSLVVNDGGPVTITPFNTAGAEVTLGSLTAAQTGVGIAPSGPALSAGEGAFVSGAESLVFGNRNLHNYMYFDGIGGSQTYTGSAHYKVQYTYPLSVPDYIVVMERWGNSHFRLQPLDADGNAIPDTNTLHFGTETWDSNAVYDWNTGYAHNSYERNQSYWLLVGKVDQFFGGSATAPPQAVYGFAVENRGEADVKFFTFKAPDCQVRSQGYWKTHRGEWPQGVADTSFYSSGKTWMEVMWTPPKGDAYYILAYQFIAAHLNMEMNNGACHIPAEVMTAYNSAQAYFVGNNPGVLSGGKLTPTQKNLRNDVLQWANTLEKWNCGY